MTYRLSALLLLLASSAVAQLDNESPGLTHVRVRVALPNGSICDASTRVLLVSSTGGRAGEAFADGDCTVQFVNVPNGSYHLLVSGQGLEDSGSESFEVTSRTIQEVEVRVTPPRKPESETALNTPLVAAADLNIPASARKEFDRANEFIARQNWKKAADRLREATTIYPRYAEAFNNLGVVYSRLGDRTQQREALLKAVAASDHFAPAYVNLARMDIADRNFVHAETLLDKATAIDPADAMTLVLLANMELMNLHYDQAIATSRRAHSVAQGPHALAHYIAARAFEQQHRAADALAELQIFLNEEQTGARAEAARREMAALQAAPH